jgi:hypothetical protein
LAGVGTDTSARLRSELHALQPNTLLRRAERLGATAAELALGEENRTAMVELLVVKVAALHRELGMLPLKALWQRARGLGVLEDKIEEAKESGRAKDALVDLVIAHHRAVRVEPWTHPTQSHASPPPSALDDILLGLKTPGLDDENTLRETQQTLEVAANIDAPSAQIAKVDHRRREVFDATADRHDTEQAPLLRAVGSTQLANTNAAPDDEVWELEKQVVEAERAKELAKRKAELLQRLAAAEADSEATPAQARAPIAKDEPGTPPMQPRSSVLDAPEPESMSVADEKTEAEAAAKVQAMWRGKAGQKQAAEQKEAVLDGSKRVVAAKRTIRNSQMAVMLLVMLTTAAGTLLPNFLVGAIFGAVTDGDGIDRVFATTFGFRLGIFTACSNYMQMELFGHAMRDTSFVPGTVERVVRPLLSFTGDLIRMSCFWQFLDLQNPDADIALIKGVPGAVMSVVGTLLTLDARAQPVELWRLYRSRTLKLPPFQASTWWQLTSAAGRGTLAAALSLIALTLFAEVYLYVYLAILTFFDKAGTMATHTTNTLKVWPYKYYFAIALPLMLLALFWGKRWPQGARDPVSTVFLCTLQHCVIYQGSFLAFNLYGWLAGPGGSVLGCQIFIEVLMLMLYLYARTLARKAFGAAPNHEARSLFMYLLLSDGACALTNANCIHSHGGMA